MTREVVGGGPGADRSIKIAPFQGIPQRPDIHHRPDTSYVSHRSKIDFVPKIPDGNIFGPKGKQKVDNEVEQLADQLIPSSRMTPDEEISLKSGIRDGSIPVPERIRDQVLVTIARRLKSAR